MLLAIVLSGCGAGFHAAGPGAVPRTLDSEPRVVVLEAPLPPGHAEAFFEIESGGDQMTTTRREAGLTVVVRSQATERRLTFASCSEPARGSALGGGTAEVLEVALCDGEYRLVAQPGEVLVMRATGSGGEHLVTRIGVAEGVRAVSPRVGADE